MRQVIIMVAVIHPLVLVLYQAINFDLLNWTCPLILFHRKFIPKDERWGYIDILFKP